VIDSASPWNERQGCDRPSDPLHASCSRPLACNAAYRCLSSLISSGGLREGDCLPGERLLSSVFDIARGSTRNALELLQRDGMVRISHGNATSVVNQFVAHTLSAANALHPGGVSYPSRMSLPPLELPRAETPSQPMASWRLGRGLRLAFQESFGAASVENFLILDWEFQRQLVSSSPASASMAMLLNAIGSIDPAEWRAVVEDAEARAQSSARCRAVVDALLGANVADAEAALHNEFEFRQRRLGALLRSAPETASAQRQLPNAPAGSVAAAAVGGASGVSHESRCACGLDPLPWHHADPPREAG
jgi:DNA-binding GntR family transcriptional regulator